MKRTFLNFIHQLPTPKSIYNSICNYIKENDLLDSIRGIQYKLSNLLKTNIELGLYHLHNGRISEALFRFKLINAFCRNRKLVLYNIGRCYFIKSNDTKALKFIPAGTTLANFYIERIKNHDKIIETPEEIIIEHFDYVAPYYAESFLVKKEYASHILARDSVLNFLKSINIGSASVLDLGCGTGVCGQFLKMCGIGSSFVGVDSSKNMCTVAQLVKHENKTVYNRIVNSNAYLFLSRETQKYDIILMTEILGYCFKPQELISMALQHINSGGLLLISVEESKKHVSQPRDKLNYMYSADFMLDILDKSNAKILNSCIFDIYKNTSGLFFVCG